MPLAKRGMAVAKRGGGFSKMGCGYSGSLSIAVPLQLHKEPKLKAALMRLSEEAFPSHSSRDMPCSVRVKPTSKE